MIIFNLSKIVFIGDRSAQLLMVCSLYCIPLRVAPQRIINGVLSILYTVLHDMVTVLVILS